MFDANYKLRVQFSLSECRGDKAWCNHQLGIVSRALDVSQDIFENRSNGNTLWLYTVAQESVRFKTWTSEIETAEQRAGGSKSHPLLMNEDNSEFRA